MKKILFVLTFISSLFSIVFAQAAAERLISILQEQAIFSIYLPFLLTFAIIYALLEKVAIFGKEARRINMVIALIIGLYVAVFSPVALTLSMFFSALFAQTSILLVTILVFLLIVGLLIPFIGEEEKAKWGQKVAPYALAIGALFVIGMFLSSGGPQLFGATFPGLPGLGLSGEDLALIALLVITIVVILFVVGGGEGEKKVGFLPFKI